MRKFQIVAGLALVASLFVASAVQAEVPARTGQPDPSVMSLVYNPADGNLMLHSAGTNVTTMEVISASGVFTGTKPAQVLPPFDVYSPTKFFLLKTPPGIGDEDFGPAVAPGMTAEALGADLSISGSINPAGALPANFELVVVPEPASVALIGLGLVGLASLRRKRA